MSPERQPGPVPAALEPPPLDGFAAPALVDEAAVDAGRSLVEALSIAWATFTAFDDPRGLEAFDRAITLLSGCPWYPVRLETAAGGFRSNGIPLESRREAARRLARSMFAHGIGAIEVAAPPSADDLLRTFRLLATPPTGEDPSPVLIAAGVESIVLLHRRLLWDEADTVVEQDEATDTDDVAAAGEERADDPEHAASMFMMDLLLGLSIAAEDDHEARSAALHAFVDAFSGLSRSVRASVVGELLRSDDPIAETFLDQLGSQELGDLAGRLDEDSHPLLLEYARLAAEHGEQRHAELHGLLTSTEIDDEPLGITIAHSVEEALRSGAREAPAAIARLRRLRPDAGSDEATCINVIKGLMAVVDDDSFASVAQSWAGRISRALTDGDLDRCDSLFAVIVGIPMPSRRQAKLLELLAAAFDEAALDAAAEVIAWTGDGPGTAIRRTGPLFLAEPLARHAATQPDGFRRLAPALGSLAASRPKPFLELLADSDPHVVVIAAFALGATRSPKLSEPIAALLGHPDAAVRTQALSALYSMLGDGAAPTLLGTLDDPHERVRSRAARLLSRIHDPHVDQVLLVRLDRASYPDEQARAIEVLAGRPSAAVTARLRHLASRRFAWSRRSRHMRDAARRALRSRS